jgi:hypothetical protein
LAVAIEQQELFKREPKMIAQSSIQTARTCPAIVSKAGPSAAAPNEYLMLDDKGVPRWVNDPEAATTFSSMRDATRMALRLPGAMRAFGLLRDVEMTLYH